MIKINPRFFSKFLSFLLLFLCIFSLTQAESVSSSPRSNSVAGSPYEIPEIQVKLFDRKTGNLSEFTGRNLPSYYGFDMDLLILVKVAQNAQADPWEKPALILTVNGESYETAATGLVPEWEETHQRSIFMAESSINYFPFIVEYQCYPQVILTAQIPNSARTKSISLPCAE